MSYGYDIVPVNYETREAAVTTHTFKRDVTAKNRGQKQKAKYVHILLLCPCFYENF